DLNNSIDNNEPNTQTGFLPFSTTSSGSEINGIVIDLSGDNLMTTLRADPCGAWERYAGTPIVTGDPCFYSPRAGEWIYRDFIYGISPSSITVTLWGLGANRDCNITLWAWDSQSTGDSNRVAHWYANDTNLFDTNFIGGSINQPRYDNQGTFTSNDLYKWAVRGRATSDNFGRIILTSERVPGSPESQPFAFINALQVEPNALVSFIAPLYAHRPVPFNEIENVPVNTLLRWRNGDGVVTHDLYLDPNFNDVNAADRTSSTLIGPDLPTGQNTGYDPYTDVGFLMLDTTYYWRVDENTPPNLYEGEVWSFTTCPNSIVDNFNRSYGASYPNRLKDTWKDNLTQSSPVTRAQVLPKLDPNHGGPPYQSMEYWYRNTSSLYYSEARAEIGTGTGKLNLDPDWLGMNAKSLTLWFYGRPTNDANEKMYVTVTDSSSNAAKVPYGGDMNNVKVESWREWNIPLTEFEAANPSVDLSNVAKITIGFGPTTTGVHGQGTVYFEDIQLYATRCALSERSDNFVDLDYAPSNIVSGDCVIDYQEIEIMADAWLNRDTLIATRWPGDANLVVHFPLDEGDGNRVYARTDYNNNPDACDGRWNGTFWNNAMAPASDFGTTWATPGYDGDALNPCVYMTGLQGARIQCGTTYGDLELGPGDLGIGVQRPTDINAMTVSMWVRWLGPRTWDSYLLSKGQGLLGKRGGYGEGDLIWTFWISQDPGVEGALGLGHYAAGDTSTPDAISAGGLLNPLIGQWVHLAASFPHPSDNPGQDANSHARLYLNGGQVDSDPWRFSHGIDPNIFLTIGQTSDQNAWPDSPASFYGYIDEVRIYNRALEPNEVAYLADLSPEDGWLWVPVPPPTDVFRPEPQGQQIVNFKDFAYMVDKWLTAQMYPR
ncbi:MAG: LamG domain-containing protein, partial [Phycisphaerae bacterium]